MKPQILFGLGAVVIAACAPSTPASTTPTPARNPAPSAAPARPATTTGATVVREAPRDWQRLDWERDSVVGIGSERAMRELLAGKPPQAHGARGDHRQRHRHRARRTCSANLWTNPKEIAGNGKDDDDNGYVDDVHGWNFIGGADGHDVEHDTYEVTRLYARCRWPQRRRGCPPTPRAPLPADRRRLRSSGAARPRRTLQIP